MRKLVLILLTSMILLSSSLTARALISDTGRVKGKVFWDRNVNGELDKGEPGIANAVISNGKEVVRTDRQGRYNLPAYDEMVVFLTKPADYDYPLNENNLPQFSYIHQPQGSPAEIKKYHGLDPTGSLPEEINFPLLKAKYNPDFKAVITGDTQVYTDQEIAYLRDTFVRENANTDAAFVLTVGDNVGDDLSLYPRYLSVLKGVNVPVFLTPGNHDMNLDASDDAHSLDTYKRCFGPTYYSFNYGKVHFVVLDSVYYPSLQFSQGSRKTYHGEINPQQLEWLRNDLSYVPYDHLIVLSMHIPLVSFVDRTNEQHHIKNRAELYSLLSGRKVVALAGHTHTVEQYLPGEYEEGWGQPIGIKQMIIGAACGSWWSGDWDDQGIPFSYQKCGSPKNYMLFDFKGANYDTRFKAIGKSIKTQMNLSFWTKSFEEWYSQISNWYHADPQTRPTVPPVNQNDLADQGLIKTSELAQTKLVANIWNGNSELNVYCKFDSGKPVKAAQSKNTGDPAALRQQLSVLRYAIGFKIYGRQYGMAAPQPLPGLFATASTHLWTVPLPANLQPGFHCVTVLARDAANQQYYEETKIFEVVAE